MKIKPIIILCILLISILTSRAQSFIPGVPANTIIANPSTSKVGIGSLTPGARLTLGSGNVTTTPSITEGITWHDATPLSYGIYRTSGSWSLPNYQQLQINWATGIILNAGTGYGKSFVEVQGDGLRIPTGKLFMGEYDAFSGNPPLTASISYTNVSTSDSRPALIVSKKISGGSLYRRMLFVPHLGDGSYNYITVDGDMGIIGQTPSNSGGFVISPGGASWAGLRITPTGNVGICTNLTTNPNNFKLGVSAANTGNGSGVLVQTSAGATYSIKLETNDSNTKAFVVEDAGVENFKILSNGKVYARAITVQLTAFPDYVFKKEYRLKSLTEVENFIIANGHLPEIPSAEIIERNGADLGEMVKLQMQKIEELTLYLIELKKENQKLNTRIETIENR